MNEYIKHHWKGKIIPWNTGDQNRVYILLEYVFFKKHLPYYPLSLEGKGEESGETHKKLMVIIHNKKQNKSSIKRTLRKYKISNFITNFWTC